MPYVDVRLSGTTTGQYFSQCFDTVGSAPVFGGTYTHSVYAALVASPNVANIGQYGVKVSDGANQFIAFITPTATLTQYSVSFTETFATGHVLQPCLFFNMTGASGQAIDVTFRLALPQLELNPNIAASVASATVAGGGAAYVGASGTMTWSGVGCATNPILNVTTSAGAINAVTSVATAGSCATFPAAGATTWTPGGGLSVGTGATFNLVPVDNSAKAFVTGPILTSGAAVTRNQNVLTASVGAYANASVFAKIASQSPSGYPMAEWAAAYGGASGIGLLTPSGAYTATYAAGGSTFSMGLGSFTQATLAPFAVAYGAGTENLLFNGSTATGANAATPSGSTLYVGSDSAGANPCNCLISRMAFFPNKQTTGQLKSLR
jgi:hypothetical protein